MTFPLRAVMAFWAPTGSMNWREGGRGRLSLLITMRQPDQALCIQDQTVWWVLITIWQPSSDSQTCPIDIANLAPSFTNCVYHKLIYLTHHVSNFSPYGVLLYVQDMAMGREKCPNFLKWPPPRYVLHKQLHRKDVCDAHCPSSWQEDT